MPKTVEVILDKLHFSGTDERDRGAKIVIVSVETVRIANSLPAPKFED